MVEPLFGAAYFSRQILFSRTFQDKPVYSSTFQACANPAIHCHFSALKAVINDSSIYSSIITTSSIINFPSFHFVSDIISKMSNLPLLTNVWHTTFL